MKSIKSRKQRKEYFNAPIHKKRKWISSHLEENLLLKYDKRRVSLIKGDTVKVMRGNFKGHEGKITQVNQRRRHVEVEGLVMTKADGKKIAKPINASNLLIVKLNLTDQWRRKKLEKTLSDDVKKEIEKEAQEQIIQKEEEKRKEEEKAKEEEKQKEIKEEVKEQVSEKEKKEITKEKNELEKEKKEKPKKSDTGKEGQLKNKKSNDTKNQIKKEANKKNQSKANKKEGKNK